MGIFIQICFRVDHSEGNVLSFQSRGQRKDVACSVVYNSNHYNIPLVLGKTNLSGSRLIATLIALAKALKIASIL
ncbi:hypothetical protein D3C87_1530530 [compost metagenome]